MPYDHTSLERKWQTFWEKHQTFRTLNPSEDCRENLQSSVSLETSPGADSRPKKYILDMFPYPSGAGLHVGHPKGYTATDIVSRYYHAKGYNVLHPMGWDAFGLPAENYAIKTGTHPSITTKKNIETFLGQMKSLGFSYDWERAVDTTDPQYYRWTQWIFTKLFEQGLAYEQDLPINYCPSCKTGLANEEVLSDHTCERCGTKVERRAIRQWVLKITDYADRLIDDLDTLDWSEGIKEMQRNWIGKSEGCEFRLIQKRESLKKPLALILHGWEGKAESNWFMSTKLELEKKGYEVIVPDLPHSATPDLGEQLEFLHTFIPRLNEQSLIIGHSLGGFLAAKFVESLDMQIRTLVLVAPTYPGVAEHMGILSRSSLNERENAFIAYVKHEIDFQKLHSRAQNTILHISEDDPYIDFASVKAYYSGIANIVVRKYTDKKHFNASGGTSALPEILTDIPSQIVFRKANQEDYEKILQIRKETGFHTIDFAREQFFVAKRDDEIAGFIRTQKIDEKTSELGALYVVEKFRKEKLGYRLIDSVIEHTEAETFLLDCKVELREYYEKYGFSYCDTPTDFQMNKLRRVWDFYGKNSTDEEIKEKTIFMKITKQKTPSISVYTTRIDTVYGMTYVVLAPDHPNVHEFITEEYREVCEKYIDEAKNKSDQDRTNEGKEKTGVFTGSYVENPFNHKSVPVWIADYVLGSYGTGAVMAVPAHDERDWEFAKKYELPVKGVIAQYIVLTGAEAPRGDKKVDKRWCVSAIIKHPYENKYLLLKWGGTNGCGLVGGGIENGEMPEETVVREIKEETGYINIKKIECVLPLQLGHGYKERKDCDCLNPELVFLVELENLDQIDTHEGQTSAHDVLWIDNDDIGKAISKDHHKASWNWYIGGEKVFTGDGNLFHSGEYDWMSSLEARKVLTEKAEKEGFGKKKVNYKLRDWLFSRQRYWGEPIPLIHISHEDYERLPRISEKSEAMNMNTAYILDKRGTTKRCKDCTCRGGCTKLIIGGKTFSKVYEGLNSKIIIDSSLPLKLPEVKSYEPTGDGQSPLAHVSDWGEVQLAENLSGKRETNTMPQWAGSCWYYLRFMDPHNTEHLASEAALAYWQKVDEYVGGTEHAVLHLLYARFWHKFLYDIKVVPTKEPFQKLTNVGMILSYAYERANGGLVAVDLVEERNGKYYEKESGEELHQVVAKMSKSLKNVINPNDIVAQYGADTLRLYEMSMGDFRDSAPWNPDAIIGVRRFLDKVYATFTEGKSHAKNDMKAMKLLHKTIKKVGEDIVAYKFNTAISALMILLNEGVPHDEEFAHDWREKFLILLHPFAPHMAEELWSVCHPELVSGSQKERGDTEVSDRNMRHDTVGAGMTHGENKPESIYNIPWPEYDEFMLTEDEVTIAIQINGKLRGTLTFLNGVAQEEVSEVARADPSIAKWLEGKEIIKEIFIPNKMLSIVIR